MNVLEQVTARVGVCFIRASQPIKRGSVAIGRVFVQIILAHEFTTLPPVWEKIGWQAKAPAPPKRRPLCANVGQTLSSANSVILPISSQTLRARLSKAVASCR